MSTFNFVVASFPLALYFITLAILHSGARPFVVGGKRDFFALALATSGFALIGPGQFAPTLNAAYVWKSGLWLWAGALYLCVVFLVALKLRPRLVVYNAVVETLRKSLTTAALNLDDEARWSGDSMNLPGLGVQFYLDEARAMRVVSVVGIGRDFSAAGWKRFAASLNLEIKRQDGARRFHAPRVLFALLGLALLAADSACFVLRFDEIREAASVYLNM